ncbi:MAG: hypothetical protein LBF28_00930 [Rickettsiales bacterium]|jgi:hypothetical protein|nr:hypothetical protein [Rickettsiales bacterium]
MKLPHLISFCLLCLAPITIIAAELPGPRVSLFSTSTDWEAVTGLRLSQHRVKILPDSKTIKNGLELYYLDAFPCYGQSDSTQIWLGANGKSDSGIMIACLFVPEKITFAWRYAARDATQGATAGLMECPVSAGGDVVIDLSKCAKGKDWKEYK